MDAGTTSAGERESIAARFILRLMIWALVCGVCVAPTTFIAASSGFDLVAILFVDGLVIVSYTLVSLSEPFEQLLRNRVTRRMLWIGFGTRMVLSIPPLCIVDLIVGAISVGAVGADVLKGHASPAQTLVIAVIDAAIMNLCLWGYMGLIYPVVRRFTKAGPVDGFCLKCGYDLRGSPERCPECGELVKNNPLVGRLRDAAASQSPAV